MLNMTNIHQAGQQTFDTDTIAVRAVWRKEQIILKGISTRPHLHGLIYQ